MECFKSRFGLSIKTISIVLVMTFAIQDLFYAAPVETFTALNTPKPLEVISQDPTRFEAPVEFVTMKEVHRGTNGKLIIHIQDAHSNYSGQTNLANALDHIMSKYGVSVVLSEGGTNDCSLTPVKKIASPEVWKRIAKSYLIQGKLSGEEYLNLISDRPMKIIGLEDPALYMKSVQGYADLAGKREEILEFLKTIQSSLDKLKQKLYPEELIRYEKVSRSGSREGGLGSHFKDLLELAASKNIDLSEFPNITKLIELELKEKLIDFNLANLEQASLIEKIEKAGGGEDLQEHLKKAEQMKGSKAAQFAYFQNTFHTARSKNISLGAYPNLVQYEEYLKDFSELDLDQVLEELEKAEDKVYSSLLASEDSRLLRSIDRYLGLLWTAYKIQMTTKEFSQFILNEPDFGTVPSLAFVNRKLAEQGYFEDMVPYKDLLEEGKKSLGTFYESVAERDLAFLRNTEKALEEEDQKVVVLITGGYHTQHLKKLFSEKGYSIAVLTPIVTSETNQAKYEELLLAPIKKENQRVETVLGSSSSNTKSLSALEEGFIQKKENDGVQVMLKMGAIRQLFLNDPEFSLAKLKELDPKDPALVLFTMLKAANDDQSEQQVFDRMKNILLDLDEKLPAAARGAEEAEDTWSEGYQAAYEKIKIWLTTSSEDKWITFDEERAGEIARSVIQTASQYEEVSPAVLIGYARRKYSNETLAKYKWVTTSPRFFWPLSIFLPLLIFYHKIPEFHLQALEAGQNLTNHYFGVTAAATLLSLVAVILLMSSQFNLLKQAEEYLFSHEELVKSIKKIQGLPSSPPSGARGALSEKQVEAAGAYVIVMMVRQGLKRFLSPAEIARRLDFNETEIRAAMPAIISNIRVRMDTNRVTAYERSMLEQAFATYERIQSEPGLEVRWDVTALPSGFDIKDTKYYAGVLADELEKKFDRMRIFREQIGNEGSQTEITDEVLDTIKTEAKSLEVFLNGMDRSSVGRQILMDTLTHGGYASCFDLKQPPVKIVTASDLVKMQRPEDDRTEVLEMLRESLDEMLAKDPTQVLRAFSQSTGDQLFFFQEVDRNSQQVLKTFIDLEKSSGVAGARRADDRFSGLAERWEETASRQVKDTLITDIKRLYPLFQVGPSKDTRLRWESSISDLPNPAQAFEIWGETPERLSFIQIGFLFFIDEKDYQNLSLEVKQRLGGNVVRIINLSEGMIGKGSYKAFIAGTIMAMFRADLAGKRWIDAGAGDGILALVAAKLGATSLDLIEIDPASRDLAKANLELNELREGAQFRIIAGDLLDPESISRQLVLTDEAEAVLGSNIGSNLSGDPWPGYTATNANSFNLLRLLDRTPGIPRVSQIIFGGYYIELPLHEGYFEVDILNDRALLEELGFEIQRDMCVFGSATRGTLSLIADRKAGARVADVSECAKEMIRAGLWAKLIKDRAEIYKIGNMSVEFSLGVQAAFIESLKSHGYDLTPLFLAKKSGSDREALSKAAGAFLEEVAAEMNAITGRVINHLLTAQNNKERINSADLLGLADYYLDQRNPAGTDIVSLTFEKMAYLRKVVADETGLLVPTEPPLQHDRVYHSLGRFLEIVAFGMEDHGSKKSSGARAAEQTAGTRMAAPREWGPTREGILGYLSANKTSDEREEPLLTRLGEGILKQVILEELHDRFGFVDSSRYDSERKIILQAIRDRFLPFLNEGLSGQALPERFSMKSLRILIARADMDRSRPGQDREWVTGIIRGILNASDARTPLDFPSVNLRAQYPDTIRNAEELAEIMDGMENVLGLNKLRPITKQYIAAALTSRRDLLATLGDALLDVIFSKLFAPLGSEHFQSKRFEKEFNRMKSAPFLAMVLRNVFREHGLDKVFFADSLMGNRSLHTQSDTLEAILAAVYLGEGRDLRIVERVLKHLLSRAVLKQAPRDFDFEEIVSRSRFFTKRTEPARERIHALVAHSINELEEVTRVSDGTNYARDIKNIIKKLEGLEEAFRQETFNPLDIAEGSNFKRKFLDEISRDLKEVKKYLTNNKRPDRKPMEEALQKVLFVERNMGKISSRYGEIFRRDPGSGARVAGQDKWQSMRDDIGIVLSILLLGAGSISRISDIDWPAWVLSAIFLPYWLFAPAFFGWLEDEQQRSKEDLPPTQSAQTETSSGARGASARSYQRAPMVKEVLAVTARMANAAGIYRKWDARIELISPDLKTASMQVSGKNYYTVRRAIRSALFKSLPAPPGRSRILSVGLDSKTAQITIRIKNLTSGARVAGVEIVGGRKENVFVPGVLDATGSESHHGNSVEDIKKGIHIELLTPEQLDQISHGRILIEGPGATAIEILAFMELFPELEVLHVVDAHYPHLEKIKAALDAMPGIDHRRIKLHHDNFGKLPFENDYFDAAYSSSIYHWSLAAEPGMRFETAVEEVKVWEKELTRTMREGAVYLDSLPGEQFFTDDNFEKISAGVAVSIFVKKASRVRASITEVIEQAISEIEHGYPGAGVRQRITISDSSNPTNKGLLNLMPDDLEFIVLVLLTNALSSPPNGNVDVRISSGERDSLVLSVQNDEAIDWEHLETLAREEVQNNKLLRHLRTGDIYLQDTFFQNFDVREDYKTITSQEFDELLKERGREFLLFIFGLSTKRVKQAGKLGGEGLGLPYVKDLVEGNGGTILISSDHSGTIFTVTLLRALSSSSQSEATRGTRTAAEGLAAQDIVITDGDGFFTVNPSGKPIVVILNPDPYKKENAPLKNFLDQARDKSPYQVVIVPSYRAARDAIEIARGKNGKKLNLLKLILTNDNSYFFRDSRPPDPEWLFFDVSDSMPQALRSAPISTRYPLDIIWRAKTEWHVPVILFAQGRNVDSVFSSFKEHIVPDEILEDADPNQILQTMDRSMEVMAVERIGLAAQDTRPLTTFGARAAGPDPAIERIKKDYAAGTLSLNSAVAQLVSYYRRPAYGRAGHLEFVARQLAFIDLGLSPLEKAGYEQQPAATDVSSFDPLDPQNRSPRAIEKTEEQGARFAETAGARLVQAPITSAEEAEGDFETLVLFAIAHLLHKRFDPEDIFNFKFEGIDRVGSVSIREKDGWVYLQIYDEEGLISHQPLNSILLSEKVMSEGANRLSQAEQAFGIVKLKPEEAAEQAIKKLDKIETAELGRLTRSAERIGKAFHKSEIAKTYNGEMGVQLVAMDELENRQKDCLMLMARVRAAVGDNVSLTFGSEPDPLPPGWRRVYLTKLTPEALAQAVGAGISPISAEAIPAEEYVSSFVSRVIFSVLLQRLDIENPVAGQKDLESLELLWRENMADSLVLLSLSNAKRLQKVEPNAIVDEYRPLLFKVMKVAWDRAMEAMAGARIAVGAAA